MDENKKDLAAPEEGRDQELFDAIGKGKRKKKVRRWITVIVIVALVAGGLTAAVIYGQKKVRDQMGSMSYGNSQVVSYTVDTGSVNTTVTGSGLLTDVDTEKLSLPEGVKVEQVLVAAGDRVEEGDLLATVELSSVLGALADTQSKITDLDAKLRSAAFDTAANTISAGVNGRVKVLYAAVGDDVAGCMFEHGALAILSLDGTMALELETDALSQGDEVTVVRAEGKELKGTVDSVMLGKAVILVTDDGPEPEETVTVRTAAGEELGSGSLYIHNPLRVTGYAGTVNAVYTGLNKQVWAGNALFALKDTAYSANYETVLRERRDQEEILLRLMDLYRSGAYEAPFAGSVASIEYKDPNAASTDNNANTGVTGYGTYDPYANYSGLGAYTAGNTGTGNGENENAAGGETALLTLSPDERMTVTINVDETDILALEPGQAAQITINSIGDIFFGEVSEVNRNATSGDGITSYTAVISLPKDERMLPGMSARVVVLIQGVDDTILIPESAVHQTRDSAFVYTSYDAETGELGGAVPVIMGLSDGSMVEIVEGLSQGDTVWYTQVWDPWSWSYGTGGDASSGDAWVSVDASEGDAVFYEEVATDGDAA